MRVIGCPSALLLLACWAVGALPLPAQSVFQQKIDSLYAAYGLTTMPDGGYIVGGLRSGCAQILRFNPAGQFLWAKKICPLNPSADINISTVNVQPTGTSGAFFVQFLKGGFNSSPDNLMDLIRLDPDGNLLWECQLRPTLRYGTIASGSVLAPASDGSIWTVHGLGYTPALPEFNQLLVFKTSASGTGMLRNFYKSDASATAQGILLENNDAIFIYGSLSSATADGFLLKINGAGAVQWARRYIGCSFYKDGGRFPNGDLLLYSTTTQGVAFARIRSADGSIVWIKRITGGLNTNHYKVAADGGVFVVVRAPNTPAPGFLVKIAPDASSVSWANRYETCTDYLTIATHATPDGGLALLQESVSAARYTRFLKVNAMGQLAPGCPAQAVSPPLLEDLSVSVEAETFTLQSTSIQSSEHIIAASPSHASIQAHCPADMPLAHVSLPDSVCAPGLLTFVADGNDQADSWQWWLPGASTDSVQNRVVQNLTYPSAGLFTVTLVQRYGACTDTFTDTLRIVPPLKGPLFAVHDTLLCPGVPMLIEPVSTDFDAWRWEDGSIHPSRQLDPYQAGVYHLLAQRGLCFVSDSFTLRRSQCGSAALFVPNAFSPNGDAQNDVWEISAQPGIRPLGSAVYDRWGNLLYTSAEGEMPHWDGHFSGKAVPPGVYVWVLKMLDVDGQQRVEWGNLTLIR